MLPWHKPFVTWHLSFSQSRIKLPISGIWAGLVPLLWSIEYCESEVSRGLVPHLPPFPSQLTTATCVMTDMWPRYPTQEPVHYHICEWVQPHAPTRHLQTDRWAEPLILPHWAEMWSTSQLTGTLWDKSLFVYFKSLGLVAACYPALL